MQYLIKSHDQYSMCAPLLAWITPKNVLQQKKKQFSYSLMDARQWNDQDFYLYFVAALFFSKRANKQFRKVALRHSVILST
jgi:hypothetical protein